MDDKPVVSPNDPRTKPKKKKAQFAAAIVIGAIIGAGVSSYRDLSDNERRAFDECMVALSNGRSFKNYARQAQFACSQLPKADAEDVVATSMLKVCLHTPDKKENIEQVFRKTVSNGAIDYCRKLARYPSVMFDDHQHDIAWDESDIRLSEAEVTALRSARDSLTREERQLIEWHVNNDLSYTEIAKRLGVRDVRTAKGRIELALQKLKNNYLTKTGN
jgi:RNA polymerase sigma factor (sigma-70 family)